LFQCSKKGGKKKQQQGFNGEENLHERASKNSSPSFDLLFLYKRVTLKPIRVKAAYLKGQESFPTPLSTLCPIYNFCCFSKKPIEIGEEKAY